MATESKSKYFHSLGELQADQEMEQALKDDDGSDWKKKQEEIEQAFKVLSDREEQKKKLKQRKDMSDGFRPKEPNAFVDAPHYKDPRLEKPALQLPAFDNPQDYSIGKVPGEMDVDAPNSFLLARTNAPSIWEDITNDATKVFEDLTKEAQNVVKKIGSLKINPEDLLRTFKDPLPAIAFKDYLVDSAKARMKAVEKRGIQTKGFKGPPSQADVDAQRTFDPKSLIESKHKEALDTFIRNTNPNEWKKSDKGKGWSSLDLLADKYKPLRDKDTSLWAIAKTLGKVSFKKDPKTNTITYADNYGFGDNEIIGPSEGPEFTIKGLPKRTEI